MNIVKELREFGATSNPGGIFENLPFAAADEIERLTAVLTGIAEFCSGDDRTLGAIARLAHVRNTADQALRHLEQKGDRK